MPWDLEKLTDWSPYKSGSYFHSLSNNSLVDWVPDILMNILNAASSLTDESRRLLSLWVLLVPTNTIQLRKMETFS